jgi:hypothetical protein
VEEVGAHLVVGLDLASDRQPLEPRPYLQSNPRNGKPVGVF